MGIPKEPKPVKLFVALLANREDLFRSVEDELRILFGPVDSVSRTLPWNITRYYEEEMGAGLMRRFVSFGSLVSPEELPALKLKTRSLEEDHRRIKGEKKGREVNVDPGYLDIGKVVLASTKNASHRIYLRSGIYAESTLMFYRGSFQPFAHTYPDYSWPETLRFFTSLRSLYLDQLKQSHQELGPSE